MSGLVTSVQDALERTDWQELAEHKLTLLYVLEHLRNNPPAAGGNVPEDAADTLEGLVCFIDAIQDGAQADGYPVYPKEEA